MMSRAAKCKSGCLTTSDVSSAVALEQLQMQQIRQIMYTSLAMSPYYLKFERFRECFLAFFHNKSAQVTLCNAEQFLQSGLDNKCRSGQTCFQS